MPRPTAHDAFRVLGDCLLVSFDQGRQATLFDGVAGFQLHDAHRGRFCPPAERKNPESGPSHVCCQWNFSGAESHLNLLILLTAILSSCVEDANAAS